MAKPGKGPSVGKSLGPQGQGPGARGCCAPAPEHLGGGGGGVAVQFSDETLSKQDISKTKNRTGDRHAVFFQMLAQEKSSF